MSIPYEKKIRKGEAHFEAGDYEAALEVFQDVLAQDPQNAYALNDAGLTAAELGQFVAAAEYFEQALTAHPQNAPAFFNLIDLLANEGEVDLAREAFQAYAAEIPDSEEKKGYREVLFKTNGHQPSPSGYQEQDLRDRLQKDANVEDVLKVGFVCGPDLKFITDIEERIAERHHVRTLYFGRFEQGQLLMSDELHLPAIQRLMDWADVVWFEWCDQILIHASNKLRKTSRVVCRLHRYEALTQMPAQVSWDFVDTLALVTPHIQDTLKLQLPDIDEHVAVEVIPNGVDLDRFDFKERTPGFNLAYVGYLHHRKNPSLLLQGLHALVQEDSRYTLHIAGIHQQPVWELYFNHMVDALGLGEHVIMHEWVEDVSTWLEDKHYLLSTSIHESFGYGIAEAMARGIKPLIHNFVGAGEIFPDDLLFNSIPELVEMVRNRPYESSRYRRYIEEHHALDAQIEAIDALLHKLGNRAISSNGAPAILTAGNSNRPDRNLIVSGITRSGTSLFSFLINEISNAVCLNEILYDIDRLPEHFALLREHLVEGKPIPNKYAENGVLTTNTLESEVVTSARVGEVDEQVVIGSKVNIPYLSRFSQVLELGYPTIALIRDPVYTIGSWNTKKARELREARVTGDNMDPLYRGFPFRSQDAFERQAEVWQHWARLIWDHRDRLTIYRYEDVVANTETIVGEVCRLFDLAPPSKEYDLKNMNRDTRYDHLDKIREAVAKYAPISAQFGYSCGTAPGVRVPSSSRAPAIYSNGNSSRRPPTTTRENGHAPPAVQERIRVLQNEWQGYLPYGEQEFIGGFSAALEAGTIRSVKCECISNTASLWQAELMVDAGETGFIAQFLTYDERKDALYLPFACTLPPALHRQTVKAVQKAVRAPNLKRSQGHQSYVFDDALLKDINENRQEYIWERVLPGTVFNPLQGWIRHINRYKFALSQARPDDVAVDVACGIGFGSRMLANQSAHVYGVDLLSRPLDFARKYYDAENIEWIQGDIRQLPFEDREVDLLTSMETFEHVPDPEEMLAEIVRVLKPGATALISTPNGNSPTRRQVENPYHEHEYSFEELDELFSRHFDQFTIWGTEGLHPYERVARTSADAHINFLVQAVTPV